METGRGAWLSAGYVLREGVVRPEWVDADLLPDRFVSVSKCLARGWPDGFCLSGWTLTAAERAKLAAEAGMDAAVLEEVQRWTSDRLRNKTLLWPDVFDRVEEARHFAHTFVTRPAGLNLLGLVVHPDDRDRWMAEFEDARGSTWNVAAGQGEFLGWEPVTIDSSGPEHSWLCNHVEREAQQRLGVKPNARGLIDDVTHARHVAALCDSGDFGAEPEPWLAVGLVQVALRAPHAAG